MKPARTDLRLLLQLMEGTIPSADREALRARLAGDQQLRERWQQLNSVADSNSLIATHTVSADDVAAFFDGTLTEREEQTFEAKCWRSPDILFELVSLLSTQDEEPVFNDELTSRLIALNAAKPIETSLEETDTDLLPTVEIKTLDPLRASKSSRGSLRFLVPALLGVIAVLLVAVVWLAVRDYGSNRIVDDEKQTPRGEQKQELVEQPAPQKTPPEDTPSDTLKPEPVTQPTLDERPRVVDLPPNEQPEPNKPVLPDMTPPKSIVPKPAPTVVAANWETRGVIAARSSPRMPWQGLKAAGQPIEANFMTLPTSRAVMKSQTGIEFVLNEQSEVVDLTWGEVSEARILRGQAAFRGLKAGDMVRFLFDDRTWEAKAHTDGTDIAVSLSDLDPILVVSAGKADVGNVRVGGARKALRFSQPRKLISLTTNQLSGLKWTTEWQEPSFSDAAIARLMGSRDLAAEIPVSDIPSTLLIAPERIVPDTITKPNRQRWREAVSWLLLNDQHSKASWDVIDTNIRNPQLQKSVKGWLKAIRQRRRLPKQEVLKIAREVANQSRAVRCFAVFYLEYDFNDQRNQSTVDGNQQRMSSRWLSRVQKER